jgi:dipeptidyl aminopeptidase/acylaminoacyl peptidase
MVQRGSFICHGIAEMDRSGVRQLDIQVGRRPTGFRLAEAFASQRGTDCPGVGWADQPTWSIGDVAAFFASTEASSLTGQPRLDAPASLYLWRPGEREATEVISGIRDPRSLRWSPDGKSLAFGGEDSDGRSGTWLVRPPDRALTRLTDVSVSWLDWSPRGDALIAILQEPLVPDDAPRRTIVRINVP